MYKLNAYALKDVKLGKTLLFSNQNFKPVIHADGLNMSIDLRESTLIPEYKIYFNT